MYNLKKDGRKTLTDERYFEIRDKYCKISFSFFMTFCDHVKSLENIELEERKYDFENKIEKLKKKIEAQTERNTPTNIDKIKQLEYNINIFKERKQEFLENVHYYQKVVAQFEKVFKKNENMDIEMKAFALSKQVQNIIILLFSNYDYLLIQFDEVIRNLNS